MTYSNAKKSFFKIMGKNLLTLSILFGFSTLYAQDTAPNTELFSIQGNPVSVAEFNYIYSKTNGDTATYSKASLEEYLELYKNFKYKVARAKELGLDTLPSIQKELEGYRKQLADSYLIDKEVTEPLAKEIFNRSGKDVDVLHISVNIPKGETDTVKQYSKIKEARERLQKGELWVKVASEVSSDASAKRNGGAVGYITAPLPAGLYELENVLFTGKTGSLSNIVRSDIAYHLVKVKDVRDARGELEGAHIFLRDKDNDPKQKQNKSTIDSLHKLLIAGASFEDLAKKYSNDKKSAPKGGYIGFFGINRFDRSFEDEAFGLTENGSFTKPFRSRVGWHIFKRISKRERSTWDKVRPQLMARVKKMPRYDAGRISMVKKLKNRFKFKDDNTIKAYISALPDTFLSYKWKPGPVEAIQLFTFDDGAKKVMLSDFTAYLRKNASKRIRMNGVQSVQNAGRLLYNDFILNQTLRYGEQRLDKDNIDFANLMREYEEGILLFEATKMNVWDIASQDTIGLKEFFKDNQANYQWKQRAIIDVFTIRASEEKALLKNLKRSLKKGKSTKEILAKFNVNSPSTVKHHERKVERGSDLSLDRLKWKPGTVTNEERDDSKKVIRIGIFRELLKPGPKELKEAKGYAIADYQDFLEKRWIKHLKGKYEFKLNQKAFDSLIKK